MLILLPYAFYRCSNYYNYFSENSRIGYKYHFYYYYYFIAT